MNHVEPDWRTRECVSCHTSYGSLVLAALPDTQDQRALRSILSSSDLTLVMVSSYAECCAKLDQGEFNVVVTDSDLPGGFSWRNVLSAVKDLRRTSTIVADRLADESRWAAALDSGCYDLVTKPFERTELRRVLSLACGARAYVSACSAGGATLTGGMGSGIRERSGTKRDE